MKNHCRMEDVVMKDLINTAICRLRIGILQRESLETLYTINAPLHLYNKTPVRQLAQQHLKVEVYRPVAQKLLDKLDHLEAERLEIMTSRKKTMEELVEQEKAADLIDVITLDEDEGDKKKEVAKEKEKRAAKRKNKREEKKHRQADEQARKKVVAEKKIAVRRREAEKKKVQDAILPDSSSDSTPAPTKSKISPEVPNTWNQTMFNMERCYEEHAFKEFRHRVLEKTREETWTAFYKRIFKEEKNLAAQPAPEFKKPKNPQDVEYLEHHDELPESARRIAAPTANKGKASSVSTVELASDPGDIKVPVCRIPPHLWPDFKNL